MLPASSPLAGLLPDLLAAGVPVLLPDAAPWDADLLRAAAFNAGDHDVAAVVALEARHSGWAALVASALSGRRADWRDFSAIVTAALEGTACPNPTPA